MPAWTTSPKKEQPTKPLLSLQGISSKRGLSTELTKSADPSAISVIIGKLPLKGDLSFVVTHSRKLARANPWNPPCGFTPCTPEHTFLIHTDSTCDNYRSPCPYEQGSLRALPLHPTNRASAPFWITSSLHKSENCPITGIFPTVHK